MNLRIQAVLRLTLLASLSAIVSSAAFAQSGLPYAGPMLAAPFSGCGQLEAPPSDKAPAKAAPERNFNPRTVLGRAIRPIINAPQVAADKVTNQVGDNDLVLGVVVGGIARAYPINMLCGPSREIINDQIGEQSIAATW